MEILCKQMENQAADNISSLAHILNLNSNIILQQELDKLFLSTYTCLKNLQLHESYIQTVNNILNDIKSTKYILLKGYKIYIYDKNFCLNVLFGSLIYSDILKKRIQNAVTEEIIFTVEYILNNFSTDIPVSILKILENILKKYRYLIDTKLALRLFMFIQKLSSSPLESSKYHSQNISKLVVPLLHTDQVDRILDVHYFPLKGIETSEFVNYFKTKVNDNIFAKKVIFKVLDMFTNNIENREGGFLYGSLLSRDLNYWSTTIWPHFFTRIQYTDFESEFFQSILKYFIPSTVNVYKMDLHKFAMNLAIPLYIKGYILLTLRRKLFIDEFPHEAMFNLSSCIMNAETRSLGLEIISLCNKRKKYPSKNELQLVKYFLYSQGESMSNEDIKSLHKFLSHLALICLDLQNITDQNDGHKETLSIYQTFLNDIQRLGHQLIEKDIIGFGAQILNIILKLQRREFNLYYKIDELSSNCVNFKTCEISAVNKNICNLIENCLIESDFSNSELTNLASCMKCDKFDNTYLMEYIEHHTYNISILTSESVKHLARVVVRNNNQEENIILHSELCNNLNKIFSEKIKSNILNLRNIFKALLLFDVLLELIHFKFKYKASVNEMAEQCFHVVDIILEHIEQGNITSDMLCNNNDQYSFKHKIKKIVEAFLNNILQYIMGTLDFLDTSKTVMFLSKIIERSNMRRPTTISAQILIKALDKHQGDHTFNEFKCLFLNDIMLKLFYASSVQQLTIRRNPESRLIIHALCVSDKNLSKPYLNWTFNELLRTLSDTTSSSSTVASALHCVETLISDNTLHNETLKFVPDVFKICVNLFDQKHWTVRNANIQLAKSLIDRFYGVHIGYSNRPKSIEDLFYLFPDLAVIFSQVLSTTFFNDSIIVVSQFFSESQIKKQPFKSEHMSAIIDCFGQLFVSIIKNNSNVYGSFAARAFVSICLEDMIPLTICDIVEYIVSNMHYIKKKHTLTNYMMILKEIYEKYIIYVNKLHEIPKEISIIYKSFQRLSLFLQNLDGEQFDLLLVKVLPSDTALYRFRTLDSASNKWKDRLWQHNYLPYIIRNCNEANLSEVLSIILSKEVLDCVQDKMLSVLLDRHTERFFDKDISKEIIGVLTEKMLELDDNKSYLLICYFRFIFCLMSNYDLKVNETLLNTFRIKYNNTKNIYKMFTIILLLNRLELGPSEKQFVKKSIKLLQELNINSPEIAEIVSEMLFYFYKNLSCPCEKVVIFKIAALLIVEYGLWDFVTSISKTDVPTAVVAMVRLLNFKTLFEEFGSAVVAFKFVNDFYMHFYKKSTYSNNCKNQNLNYYAEERNIYVHKSILNKIVLKFLFDYSNNQSNSDIFRYYKDIVIQNKR